MITKKELSHIASGLHATCPMVRDYNVATVREMKEAVKQWRKDVEKVASMIAFAQAQLKAKEKTFNRAEFLKACGIEDLDTLNALPRNLARS